VLENNLWPTDRNTFAAIGAFFLDYNHGAVLALIDSFFGAYFLAFAALNADARLECPRLRKERFNPHSRFLRIYFLEMLDCANLRAQAASGTVAGNNFYSFFIHYHLKRDAINTISYL
jgi:hypothetical protein